MAPDPPEKSRLRAVLEQLAIIGGVTAVISLACALLDLAPQRNAALSIAAFLFFAILWWRQQANRIPSSLILALLIPGALVTLYFVEGDACFKRAKRSGKPYEIHNITYFLRVEADGDPTSVTQSHRIVYSLRATRDIKASDDLFDEEIHSDHDKAVSQRWHGTEQEYQHADIKPEKFQVHFPMKAGESRTIVTGANFRIPYPFTPRSILDGQQSAGTSDDSISYPNTADDVICDVLLIVESSSFVLSEIAHSGTTTQPVITAAERGGVTTISARWADLNAHETAWLHYRIELKSTQNAIASTQK
ncbi:MAG TPA: hypothetical protein VF532_10675 [Candidatus Angelobacter sp.]